MSIVRRSVPNSPNAKLEIEELEIDYRGAYSSDTSWYCSSIFNGETCPEMAMQAKLLAEALSESEAENIRKLSRTTNYANLRESANLLVNIETCS